MTMSMTTYSDIPQQPIAAGYAYIPDQLIAGALQLVTQDVTLAQASATLSRGSLLGKVTATGNYALSKATATDGSQTPGGVLVDYADPTAGAVSAGMYVVGEFNGNVITAMLDPTWTSLAAAVAALPVTVIVKTNVMSAADPT